MARRAKRARAAADHPGVAQLPDPLGAVVAPLERVLTERDHALVCRFHIQSSLQLRPAVISSTGTPRQESENVNTYPNPISRLGAKLFSSVVRAVDPPPMVPCNEVSFLFHPHTTASTIQGQARGSMALVGRLLSRWGSLFA
jgi:hypothetical protein